jgi:hypothetical protein
MKKLFDTWPEGYTVRGDLKGWIDRLNTNMEPNIFNFMAKKNHLEIFL